MNTCVVQEKSSKALFRDLLSHADNYWPIDSDQLPQNNSMPLLQSNCSLSTTDCLLDNHFPHHLRRTKEKRQQMYSQRKSQKYVIIRSKANKQNRLPSQASGINSHTNKSIVTPGKSRGQKMICEVEREKHPRSKQSNHFNTCGIKQYTAR